MSRIIQDGGTPRANVNVDIAALDSFKCDSCQNQTFAEVAILKRLPKLISPSGKDEVIAIPVMSCNSCGHVNEEFLPPQLRAQNNINKGEVGTNKAESPIVTSPSFAPPTLTRPK